MDDTAALEAILFVAEEPITETEIEAWSGDASSFANGAVRVFAFHANDAHLSNAVLIGVLHPAKSQLADGGLVEVCSAIYSDHGQVGYFGHVFTKQMKSSYDPARGLMLTIPVRYHLSDRSPLEYELTLTINQATGTIDVSRSIP